MSKNRASNSEKELEILANELARVNTSFFFFQKLHANYQRLTAAKDFWDYTISAHGSIALQNLSRIYDIHLDGLNLYTILKSIDVQRMDQATRNQFAGFLDTCGPKSKNALVLSLRKWRNNIIAHYNSEVALDREGFDVNNPADPEQILSTLIELGFNILEWCRTILGNITPYPRFAPGMDGCESVLKCLHPQEILQRIEPRK